MKVQGAVSVMENTKSDLSQKFPILETLKIFLFVYFYTQRTLYYQFFMLVLFDLLGPNLFCP